MVVTQLLGGLGNQMFQYAAGRALAVKLETELALDAFAFKDYTLRRYELGKFNINEKFCSPVLVRDGVLRTGLSKAFSRFGIGLEVRREKRNFVFDPDFFAASKRDIYIKGYWQSPRYFLGIRDQLRREFSLKAVAGDQNAQYSRNARAGHSVSVHVRRGDYITNADAARFHGHCGLDYYQRASEFIADRVQVSEFFVFSDDHKWARENLKFPAKVSFVDINSSDSGEQDLDIMRNCRHHIIANSSFSWWAAWLSASEDKIVICPEKWVTDPSVQVQDLIPDSWIKLS